MSPRGGEVETPTRNALGVSALGPRVLVAIYIWTVRVSLSIVISDSDTLSSVVFRGLRALNFSPLSTELTRAMCIVTSSRVKNSTVGDHNIRPNQSWPCLVPVGGLRRLTSPAVGQLARRGASAGQGTGNGLQ